MRQVSYDNVEGVSFVRRNGNVTARLTSNQRKSKIELAGELTSRS